MDLVHIHEKEIKDLNLMEEEKFGKSFLMFLIDYFITKYFIQIC